MNQSIFVITGIGEDSEDLSAAGQNATILGCKTIDDIYAAVQKCWASLFTYQSVEYRRYLYYTKNICEHIFSVDLIKIMLYTGNMGKKYIVVWE